MLFLNNPTLLKITPKVIFISPKENNFSPNKKITLTWSVIFYASFHFSHLITTFLPLTI